MFGTLKPRTCRLGCAGRQAYETFYCGLCKSLGDNYGTHARALLSYDAVFLAIVADGLVDEGAAPDRCRCPLLPIAFRPTVRPDSPAMRYAAAMQMLLADQWLADRAMDGRRAARAARPLLGGKVEAARGILAGLGISLADLDGFEERQARREVPGETAPREAAEPTSDALARVFERMALLPGASADARSEEGRAALAAFGRDLGSAIYLIDALDDLEKDHRGGAFNPCLYRAKRGQGMRVSWARVEAAWALLHDDLAALAALVETLPFRRHRDLVRSVAAVELPRLARAAAQKAHAYARAEDQRSQLGPWPRRLLALAAAAFVLAWVWLWSIPALARGPKRPSPPGTSSTADAGGVPPSWEPKLPPAPRPSAQPQGDKPPPPPASAAPAAPKPSGSAAPDGTGSSSGGTGWGNPCKGCSSGSGNPCSGCGDCCDVCKKCDCGGCCKACDSCNTCFSSCGKCCGK